jgi:hypothetical protein
MEVEAMKIIICCNCYYYYNDYCKQKQTQLSETHSEVIFLNPCYTIDATKTKN